MTGTQGFGIIRSGCRLLACCLFFCLVYLGATVLVLKENGDTAAVSQLFMAKSPFTRLVGDHGRQLDNFDSSPVQAHSLGQRHRPQFPIILMGLPHSGSLELHLYFQCLGLVSRHYCCNPESPSSGHGNDNHGANLRLRSGFPCTSMDATATRNNLSKERTKGSTTTTSSRSTCGGCILNNMKVGRDAFYGCDHSHVESNNPVQVWASFDLETRDEWFLPQHFTIGLLHQAYPNATWILNKQFSSRAWAESILHWHSKTRRFFASFDLSMYPHPIPNPPDPKSQVTTDQILTDLVQALEGRLHNRTEHSRKLALLEQIYDQHTTLIRRWARHLPSHHFIEIDVDNVNDENPPVILKDFLSDEALKSAAGKKCAWKADSSTQTESSIDFLQPFSGRYRKQ